MDGFAEFKVHLIHRKQVPVLHITVLILCDEGDGMVALDIHHNLENANCDPLKRKLNNPILIVSKYIYRENPSD